MKYCRSAALLLASAIAILATPVQAEPSQTPLILSIYAEHADNDGFAAKGYTEAVKKMRSTIRVAESDGGRPASVAKLYTSLCALQTMQGDLDVAARSCGLAVARARQLTSTSVLRVPDKQLKLIKAASYSNRGVVRALQGNSLGALDDFAFATKLKPTLNIAR